MKIQSKRKQIFIYNRGFQNIQEIMYMLYLKIRVFLLQMIDW